MDKKEHLTLSIRINEATKKLKEAGYVVFNDDDKKFAILAHKQRHICKSQKAFFDTTIKLTEKNEEK